jgi:hypothetical protein
LQLTCPDLNAPLQQVPVVIAAVRDRDTAPTWHPQEPMEF